MKWYSNDTQIAWACRELLKGREISHVCEIAEAKGWRLSAIIYNLRHRYKWPIETRYGTDNVAFYRLKTIPDKLEMPRSVAQKKKESE